MKKLFNHISEFFHDVASVWLAETKNVFSDGGVIIFFIIVPLLYPLLYSWIYNNEIVTEVPVAIVDNSHSAESREFVRRVNASPSVDCKFYCNNLAEAQDLIGRQQVYGIIYFPDDFGRRINRHEQASVGVYCDMSLMLNYKAIYQTTQGVSSMMNTAIQIEGSQSFTSRDEEITTKPLDFEEVQIFNTTGGYGNSVLPGVLMIVIQQTLLLGVGLIAGTWHERKKYRELVPLSHHFNGVFRMVLGKSLCYFIIYLPLTAYVAMLVPKFFSFTSLLTPQAAVGLLVPFLLACIFFSMTISYIVRYRENVMLIVVFTSLIFLFMTGISWPENNIPAFWRGVSWVVPSTFGVKGFLVVSSMGGTLTDIKPEYQALWAQVIVYFLLSCLVYRLEINKAEREMKAEQDAQ